MAIGDPIPGAIFSDAIGWFYPPSVAFRYTDLREICTQCGAPIADHFIGGPGDYHPVHRSGVWFWACIVGQSGDK